VAQHSNSLEASSPRDFRTTRWSLVLRAGGAHEPTSAEALESLCRTYWRPLFAFVLRRGFDEQTAQDLTQGFFADLLERKAIARADHRRGKFRTFLLSAFENFLANEWDKQRRMKRGGQFTFVPMDVVLAEQQRLAGEELPPDKLFERRWAEELIARALGRLKAEMQAARHATRYEVLKAYLVDDKGALPYENAAEQTGLSLGALKTVVRRMRLRYGQLMREEIAETVSSPAEVDDEIRHLLAVLEGTT
jgi:RNA polymerase sigma factor (sigma-70 family)